MTINKEIINVLNNNEFSFEEKLSELRKIRDHRRGQNLVIVQAVIEILKEYHLPINNEKFNNGEQVFRNFNLKSYEIIRKIARESTMSLFNASCNELLFYHYSDIKMAEQAIKNYFDELISPTNEDEFSTIKHLLGICRLFSKIGVKYIDSEKFLEICQELIDKEKDNNYTPVFLLKALEEIKDFSVFFSAKLYELISYFDKTDNYQKSIDCRNLLIETNKKDKEIVKTIKWEIVELKKKQADTFDWNDSKDSFHIIHIVKEAMAILSQINDEKAKEERKQLAKKIEPVKELSLEQIKAISLGSIDLSQVINDFKREIEDLTFEETINVALNNTVILNIEYCKKYLTNSSDMFTSAVLDSKGRTLCIVPSPFTAEGDEIIHFYEYKAMQHYQFIAEAFYVRFLAILKDKYNIKKEELKFLVENNAFVPDDRKESFLIGIEAGFRYDFVTALHVLMPQVENAIRLIAEELGAVVYKTNDDGTEECLSFEGVLKLPEVIDALDEDFIFNLKVHYTSKYGFAMRNNVSHGLDDDNSLNSANGLAVWWYTLYLCCKYSYNLRKRISEIKKGRQK